MSNQACLFAEDMAAPYNPFAQKRDPLANTVHIAGAAYQVPAYWLFCFDASDIVAVESEEGAIPALVSETSQVRVRLAARDRAARELFPNHMRVWDEFRKAVEAVGRKYLKIDAYEIWMLYKDDGEFGRLLKAALGWFVSGEKTDLDALLFLAGIEGYDRQTRDFPVSEGDDSDQFLYGWLGDF